MNIILLAFLLTTAAGLSTGIGSALPFFFRSFKEGYLAFFLGLSAGVMILVSFVELLPGAAEELGTTWSLIAFFVGMVVVVIIDQLIPKSKNPHHMGCDKELVTDVQSACADEQKEMAEVESMKELEIEEKNEASEERETNISRTIQTEEGKQASIKRSALIRTGVLSAIAIAIHNFPEGIATFATTLEDPSLGISIMIAIAIHNIPEGVSVSIPIYYATKSKWKSFGLSLASGVAEPIGALVAFGLLQFLPPTFTSASLAFVAGVMVYISIDELIPIAFEYGEGHVVMSGIVIGMLIMAASLVLLGGPPYF
jgi:ZIP family zinc transporter